MKLNEMQKKVVGTTEGSVLVLAGAGAGKTAVLIERIKKIISKGVNEENICVISFTNKAACELAERLEKAIDHAPKVMVGTFHSIALMLIREEIRVSKYMLGFDILSEEDISKLVLRAIKNLNLDLKEEECIRQIGKFKWQALSPREATHSNIDIVKVYEEYQNLLQQYNRIDFDEILLEAVRIMKDNPGIRKKWAERIKYLMVDEYQDTNLVQYNFIKLLKGQNSNLCVVGDDYQSIYLFRGADINIILNFEKNYKASVLKLEQNYRSTQTIVNASKAVILNNKKQAHKDIFTCNLEGENIKVGKFRNEKEEAAFIAKEIRRKISSGQYEYKDFAVLYRANKLADEIRIAFDKERIPYKTLEKWEKPLSVESISMDIQNEEKEKENKVTLLTVHSSKGLEFRYVFLIGVEQGIFPSQYMTKGDLLDEERRLMYVAMTRAEESLHLSYVETRNVNNKITCGKPSIFLKEIPRKYIQFNSAAERDFAPEIQAVTILSKDILKHPIFGEGRLMRIIDLKDSLKAQVEVEFSIGNKILDVQF